MSRLIDADALKKEIRFYAKTLYQNIKHSRTKDFQPSRDFVRGVEVGYCQILSALKAMPTIDPLKWTPVSERLPEEDTDVLISYRYKEGEGDTSHVYIDITSYGDMYFGGRKVKGAKHWRQPFEYFTSNYEVIAWMPLPEPWRGEEDERTD